MRKETAIEVGKPFLDSRTVVHPTEGNFGQIENLCRTETKAQEMEEEEIVQLIRPDQVFRFLLDIAVFIGGNQFGLMGVSIISNNVFRESVSTPV